MHNQYPRREFIQRISAVGAGAAASLAHSQSPAADLEARRVVLGVMGLGRGQTLTKLFSAQPNIEIRYLCDTDQQRIDACRKSAVDAGLNHSFGTNDFRRILDDPEVDALICAAPNHWHAPATLLACQASKHVYVEKPCSHNPWEGEAMVQVADQHRAIVQLGTQRRSSPGIQLAIQRVHDSAIGRAYLARGWYQSARGSIGRGQLAAVPAALDYELWQGPAPRRKFVDNLVHYNWHWRWHWGNGELGNNGIHTLDLCRWGLEVNYPTRVSSTGGRYAFDDDQQTPDTHTVGFEFGDQKAITWHALSCNRHRPRDQAFVTFYGTEGSLELEQNGCFQVYDRADRVVETHQEIDQSTNLHVANFLEAIRRDDETILNAPILEGHRSTLLCHLGNIAHRIQRALHCDPNSGKIQDDSEAMELWQREYAPKWEPMV